ncbi:nucleotide exchange factor GrpE [Halorhodospira halochloris]|nr:nucleotide exchange factor GrpE [Halorhodospira halochloris]MCG5531063.1 nucleotide exchange factor GrpE [Halorhodospira halochloris]
MSDKHRDSPNEANKEEQQVAGGNDHHRQEQTGSADKSAPGSQGGSDSATTENQRDGSAGSSPDAAIEGDFIGAAEAQESSAEASQGSAASGKVAADSPEVDGATTSQQGGVQGSEDDLADSEQPEAEQQGGNAEEQDPAQLQARIEQLEAELAEARQQVETHRDQALRIRAEMENMQRRAQKDVEQAKRQGLEKVASDLLQVKDSLEMGVQAAEDEEADRAKLLEGSQLTLKMLNQVFERAQIEEIDPQGERFNPDYHEAMAAQPSSDQEPNTVLHVVQKGYRLEERLLRPALVVVAKKADDAPGGQSGGSVDESV